MYIPDPTTSPVFLEYNEVGDVWVIHLEHSLDTAKKQEYDPVPYRTACQLNQVEWCSGCFPPTDTNDN